MSKYCAVILIKVFLLFAIKYGNAQIEFLEHQTQGLYDANDHVLKLNAKTFGSYVPYSKSSWLVEFYSSWCGHCQRFAPIWKKLAKNVLSWRPMVHVAAVDCSNSFNTDFCQKQHVHSYPMIKFFSANSEQESKGTEIDKGRDEYTLQNSLLTLLETEQQNGRGSSWPKIIPYRENIEGSIWGNVQNGVKHIILIVEQPVSFVGTDIISEYANVSNIHVRRVVYSYIQYPELHIIGRNGLLKRLNIAGASIAKIRELIQKYTKAKPTNDLKPTEKSTTDSTDVLETLEHEKFKNSIQKYGDVVFQEDLIKAVKYSINNEISLSETIGGEKMKALKAYLNILASYLPLGDGVNTYLRFLSTGIANKYQITGESFRDFASQNEAHFTSAFSRNDDWVGCRGSKKTSRRYPCGLWTMFHLLTVNFASDFSYNQHPATVLQAMFGYIKYFFGCKECSDHFVEMANKNDIYRVRTADESILWLWKAHNEVNRRLAGDLTEDPQHKKIQYPSKNDCPSCRNENDEWMVKEVLLYLKTKYTYNGNKRSVLLPAGQYWYVSNSW